MRKLCQCNIHNEKMDAVSKIWKLLFNLLVRLVCILKDPEYLHRIVRVSVIMTYQVEMQIWMSLVVCSSIATVRVLEGRPIELSQLVEASVKENASVTLR